MSQTPRQSSGAPVSTGLEHSTRVFISYSRHDLDFVSRLAAGLNAAGCFCDFDVVSTDPNNVVAGISAEDEWWKRLEDMITLAHVVVFVVSQHSSRSKVCDEEVAFALSTAKRVVAVTYGPVDFAALPPRISALNMAIHFHDGAAEPAYSQALERLGTVAQLDVHWHRVAAEVAVAARKWDDHGRGDEALARGSELQPLQEWAARRPASAPPHPELVLAYLAACQKAEAERAAVSDAERARYLEIMEVARPLLEAEMQAREAQAPSDHPGVRKEQEVELERIKSLLVNRWHPQPAKYVASTGAVEGYAEIFIFPCCNRTVRDFLSTGESDPPHQFRSDGCQEIPQRLQHTQRHRSNPFHPLIGSKRSDESQSQG